MVSRTSNLVCLALAALIASTILAGAVGCGGGGDDDDGGGPMADCSGDVPTFDQLSILDICTGCHSSELSGEARMQAPAGINFDTYESAVTVSLTALGVLGNGTMPPPGIEQPSEAQKQDFYDWAGCGTPQ
jgi:uncharacterized membrane protein